MKEYKRIELNEKEYLMVTEETNVFEVVVDATFDALVVLGKILYNMIVKSK